MGAERGQVVGYDGVSTRQELQAIIWRMRADLERFAAQAGPARMETPGVAGDWTLKDVIAHLAAWRWVSVARLEAVSQGTEPTMPYDDDLDEERPGDVDRINRRFHEAGRARPVEETLRDSRATLDRLEAALLTLSDADLFARGRHPWLGEYPPAAIITHSAKHLYEDHEPGISAFLARGNQH
jgi:hypothetical protein